MGLVKKISSYKLLFRYFNFLPSEITYKIYKYVGKKIYNTFPIYRSVKYKFRREKYFTKHKIGKRICVSN